MKSESNAEVAVRVEQSLYACSIGEMEDTFTQLAANTGFPADQLKYIFCLLLLAPIAIPFRYISSPTVKHLWSIVVSSLMLSFCLGPLSLVHSFVSALVSYLMMLYLPHGVAHRAVFVVILPYFAPLRVSFLHIIFPFYSG